MTGSLRRLEEGQQQSILSLAERDRRFAGIDELSAAAFQFPSAESIASALGIAGPRSTTHLLPPQHSPDAGQQLSQGERLDDVVVGAELEPDDTIDLVGAVTGRDDHRHVGMRTDLPQQIQTVVLAEAKVENDQAGLTGFEIVVQLGPGGGRPGRDVVLLQISDHHLTQGGVVVDNDDVANICKHTTLSNLA